MAGDVRYNVMLPAQLNEALEQASKKLGTMSKADALRKAIILLNHALDAQSVEFVNDKGERQKVLLS